MSDERCHCGRPLHYTNPASQAAVTRLVELFGARQPVRGPDGRIWLVPRHYIALHGLKADELHTLGFELYARQIDHEPDA
jgi:hypothetical protein